MPGKTVMTDIQALRILKLTPSFTTEQVQKAYATAMQQRLAALPFAQTGQDRDARYAEIAAMNDAYTVLTGSPPPTQLTPPPAGAGTGPSRQTHTPSGSTSPAASTRPTSASPTRRPSPRPATVNPVPSSAGWTKHISAFCRWCQGAGTTMGGALRDLFASIQAAVSSTHVPQVAAVVVFVVLCLGGIQVSRWVGSHAFGPSQSASSVTNDRAPQQVYPTVVSAASVSPPVSYVEFHNNTAPRPTGSPYPKVQVPHPRSGGYTSSPNSPPTPAGVPITPVEQPASSGALIVKSHPWARVEVNGRFLDDAPWLAPKMMSNGLYTVTLTTESGKRIGRQVEIQARKTTVVTWVVKKNRFEVTHEESP